MGLERNLHGGIEHGIFLNFTRLHGFDESLDAFGGFMGFWVVGDEVEGCRHEAHPILSNELRNEADLDIFKRVDAFKFFVLHDGPNSDGGSDERVDGEFEFVGALHTLAGAVVGIFVLTRGGGEDAQAELSRSDAVLFLHGVKIVDRAFEGLLTRFDLCGLRGVKPRERVTPCACPSIARTKIGDSHGQIVVGFVVFVVEGMFDGVEACQSAVDGRDERRTRRRLRT